MSAGPSRRRAALFVVLALGCAAASVAIAARYGDAAAPAYGPLRPVVVLERELSAGERIDATDARRALTIREVPGRFVPPDALGAVEEAIGARPRAGLPAGSYLLTSQLGGPRRGRSQRLPAGLAPLAVTVAGAEGLAAAAGGSASRTEGRVDVVAALELGVGGRPRVKVLARRVPLLSLSPLPAGADAGPGSYEATLALPRAAALEVIEAENFARELRLLPWAVRR